MATTEELTAKLEALKCALYEGALEVRYQDKFIKYRTYEEMKKTIADLEKELGIAKKRCTRLFANFDKGTC